jgi:hypothetical protein
MSLGDCGGRPRAEHSGGSFRSSRGKTASGRVWRRPGRPDPDASLRWLHGPAVALLLACSPWLLSVWRSWPRPLQAPRQLPLRHLQRRERESPSGGGGRSAGSPPPGTGHPDPGWRASAPPPASGAFWEGIERPGWRDPEASSDVLRGQEFLQGHFQLKLGRDVFAAISRWTTRTRVLRLFLHR